MSESEGKKPADTETAWSKGKAEFTGKSYSKYFDPCEEAAQRSLKCLRRNGGDRLMCTDYFEYAQTATFTTLSNADQYYQSLQGLQEVMGIWTR
ncbi:Cytochrome c oxidase-assembly factor cox-23, mitochondrial [Cryoendolithus antarcticus]|uniref:Cytochrome c oxidase-assembly factor cox-23, mitochondrial n=1 Tax=Cryoendolithus antarcticus TaxID=1507870 RepID=A0A1V8T7E3_9PEZI|nr:Cytochrome c oxidase-assembly factor cox-23, mitochondrial [Cryoendolithus antarcticus]